MRSTIKYETGTTIGWLLVGLTVLPLVAARAEETTPAEATERLVSLLAHHDARALLYLPPAKHAECAASEKEDAR